ncbi:MAG: LssY C-terminal domain-containing protein [Elusimicrobia bacterium]|nr:LssY C-terminal domain-containing protein [Elusimicrobiota bacterium]
MKYFFLNRRGEVLLLPVAGILLCAYLLASYVLLPAINKPHTRSHIFSDFPKTTTKKNGIPGDPFNIGLVGSEADVVSCMRKAGWHEADKLNFMHALREVGAVLFHQHYNDAPVSSLYAWGRKQDIAFEELVTRTPSHRHHVRFWKTDIVAQYGRAFWVGSATFDRKVGFSHFTGEITHHIAADIDAEREKIVADLTQVNAVGESYYIPGAGFTMSGVNGEGDRYFTDGKISVVVVTPQDGAAGPVAKH